MYGRDAYEYSLEYAEQFWEEYANEPKFFRLGFIDGHEGSLEVIKYLDEPLLNMIKKLDNKGFLEDTAIVFASDHGDNMFGFIRFVSPDFHVEKYLREIIHTSKMSDMKNELEKMLTSGNNVVKINLISRCVFVNYVELSDYVRYVMLTEGGVELLQGRLSHGVLEKNEWEVNLAEQKIDEYVKYKYEDIIKIYQFVINKKSVTR